MMDAVPPSTETRRRFLRFASVGGLGFLVDASVLSLLVNIMGHGHYLSRAVSFTLAVTVTWLINRRWVFQAGSPTRSEYSGYVLVQLIGAVINLAVYVLVIELVPKLAAIPVVPLAVGASVAMLANFLLAQRFIYRRAKAAETI